MKRRGYVKEKTDWGKGKRKWRRKIYAERGK
jgi:hypothetical protein